MSMYDDYREPASHASKRRLTINDADREGWVDNDEGMHAWWRGSRLSKRAFVRANRAEIDRLILAANKPRERTWREYI